MNNYLVREDFIKSVDSKKIWLKSMTLHEAVGLLNILENEINKHDYVSDKNFLMDGRRNGLKTAIEEGLSSNGEHANEEILELLRIFWEFVNNEYCVATRESMKRLHLNRDEIMKMCVEYARKGIICLEEKDIILEMINKIREYLNYYSQNSNK